MAYDELLGFSAGRYPWQQDALRRLALSGELTPDDLEDLRLQIEQAAGFPVEDVADPDPLAAAHLSHAASNDPKTVLVSLGPVRHVDRLSSHQLPLRFAVNGVTIVYGPNGSGKSGYCRIARQLCRSVTPVQLRGNVYGADAPNTPEVGVAFRVGGDDQEKEEQVWFGDQDPPPELARISVFDAATARVYVDSQRTIRFLPYELDLLNKLGLARRELDRGFRARITNLNPGPFARPSEGYQEGTAVHAMLGRLVLEAEVADLPAEHELRELAIWTELEQAELDRVEEQIEADPRVLIRLRTDARRALEIVRDDISSIEGTLSEPAIAAIVRAKHEADTTLHAAEVAARRLFSDQPVPEVGSEPWVRLLNHAREFAATAFPDAPPPQIAGAGLCVLCQQALDEDATSRLAEFDDYVSGRAAEESGAAARALAEHRERLLGFRIRSRREVETLLGGYAALVDDGSDVVARITTFVDRVAERLVAITRAIRQDRYDSLAELDPPPESPGGIVEREIARLTAEIAELERAGRDENFPVRLQARHGELTDLRRLNEEIELVVKRRNRLEERRRLDVCLGLTRSNEITRHITHRRREILTPTLRESLHRELDRFGLSYLPLDLSDHGEGAESIVEIALSAQQRIRNNSDVLSEGEQRGLALACFLAELHEIGGDHGIIVDDPVSSLDHGHMKAVAERLSEETSLGRQVIVFTHNIVFHHMLWTEARRVGVGRHREWMYRAGDDRVGLIDAAQQPWQLKRVPQRLYEVRQDFDSLVSDGYDPADQSYRPAIIDLYTKMRSTWECIVEDVLFNDVVQRFREEVMTLRLRAAYFDPATDYPLVFEGMKRCSRYSGHEPALDLPPELPAAGHVERDIEELRAFFAIALDRRKRLDKAPSPEDGVEAELL